MFEFFNLIALMGAGAMATGLAVFTQPDDYYVLPRINEVAYVTLHALKKQPDEGCHYMGVMAPYARDWEETVESEAGSPNKLPPEPDKLIGYGLVINKKVCPGKPDEAVMMAYGYVPPYTIKPDNPYNVFIGVWEQVRLVNLVGAKEADIPKWLPQVSKIIDSNAAGNKVAKDFLDFSAKAAADAKAKAAKNAQEVKK